VQDLALRAGIRRVPDAYLLQAGGALNAVATKFLRSRFVVLYSDLLEACGDDEKARDMIIGHELGHIRAGHLNGMWLLAPGFLVPFLGAALSRAREYTCDRYGLALSGDTRGALAGLTILAAGKERGPHVNVRALAHQKLEMNTGWMTIGKWLAGHPPLCDRVSALEPSLSAELRGLGRGPARASLGILLVASLSFFVVVFGVVRNLPKLRAALSRAAVREGRAAAPARSPAPSNLADSAAARETVDRDLKSLAKAAEDFRAAIGSYPADSDALYGFWRSSRKGAPEPLDPFTSEYYLYSPSGDQFLLWSAGPDGTNGTADDIHLFGGAKVE
jgi:hypothetical protein